MNEALKQFLYNNVTPEAVEIAERAYAVLDSLNVEDLESTFTGMLALEGDVENTDIVYSINTQLNQLLIDQMYQFEIIPLDTNTEFLTTFLTGYQQLTKSEETESIITALTSGEDYAWALADALFYVTELQPEESCTKFQVSKNVIKRLVAAVDANSVDDTMADEDFIHGPAFYKARALVLFQHCQRIPQLLHPALENGLNFGNTFDTYITPIIEGLNQLTPAEAAEHLLGAGLMSVDVGNGILPDVYAALDKYIYDTAQRIEVSGHVRKLFAEYNKNAEA
jgi:hypothetical protein